MYDVGVFDHVPVDDVSVCPSCAVPVTVGGDWFDGAALDAASDSPATTRTVTAPAASSASTLNVRVIRNPPFPSLGRAFPATECIPCTAREGLVKPGYPVCR